MKRVRTVCDGIAEEEASQSDEGRAWRRDSGKDKKGVAAGIGTRQEEQQVGRNGGAGRHWALGEVHTSLRWKQKVWEEIGG